MQNKEVLVAFLKSGSLDNNQALPQILSNPRELSSDEVVKTVMAFATWMQGLPKMNKDWDKVEKVFFTAVEGCKKLKASIENTREVDSELNIKEKTNEEKA